MLDLIVRARDIHGISSIFVTKALHEIPYLAKHRAVESKAGSHIEKISGYVPDVRVLLLDEGKLAFFGSPQEFAQSSLPEVQHMLHPVTEAIHGELDVDDPWQQNRKSKGDLE